MTQSGLLYFLDTLPLSEFERADLLCRRSDVHHCTLRRGQQNVGRLAVEEISISPNFIASCALFKSSW